MPNALYETRPAGIIRVVFSVEKAGICFVQYNYHNSLQEWLIEGIENCVYR